MNAGRLCGLVHFAHNERADTNEYLFGITASLPLPLWNMNTGKIESEKSSRRQGRSRADGARARGRTQGADAEFVYRSRREESNDLQKSFCRKCASRGNRRHATTEMARSACHLQRNCKAILDSIDGVHRSAAERLCKSLDSSRRER